MQNPIGAHGFLALAPARPFEVIEAWRAICHVPLWDELRDECFNGWHVIGGLPLKLARKPRATSKLGCFCVGFNGPRV